MLLASCQQKSSSPPFLLESRHMLSTHRHTDPRPRPLLHLDRSGSKLALIHTNICLASPLGHFYNSCIAIVAIVAVTMSRKGQENTLVKKEAENDICQGKCLFPLKIKSPADVFRPGVPSAGKPSANSPPSCFLLSREFLAY